MHNNYLFACLTFSIFPPLPSSGTLLCAPTTTTSVIRSVFSYSFGSFTRHYCMLGYRLRELVTEHSVRIDLSNNATKTIFCTHQHTSRWTDGWLMLVGTWNNEKYKSDDMCLWWMHKPSRVPVCCCHTYPSVVQQHTERVALIIDPSELSLMTGALNYPISRLLQPHSRTNVFRINATTMDADNSWIMSAEIIVRPQ